MITVSEARKLLPHGYQLTDEELASVIADWYAVANIAMDEFLRRKRKEQRYDRR